MACNRNEFNAKGIRDALYVLVADTLPIAPQEFISDMADLMVFRKSEFQPTDTIPTQYSASKVQFSAPIHKIMSIPVWLVDSNSFMNTTIAVDYTLL